VVKYGPTRWGCDILSIRWNKTPPAPQLSNEIIEKTKQKYLEAYEKLVEKNLGGV
jgi:phosphoribosylaminoimidazole-succinocarboxamide synthase